MRTKPLTSVFKIEASPELERLLGDFETLRPETIDAMRAEIRRQTSLQTEALSKKYPNPRERIIYRFLLAKELRLAAILIDNRLLWEGANVPSR